MYLLLENCCLGCGKDHACENVQNNGGDDLLCLSARWQMRRRWWVLEGGSLCGQRWWMGEQGQESGSAFLLYQMARGAFEGTGGCYIGGTSWGISLLHWGHHHQAEGSGGAGGVSTGILEDKKMRRVGQIVESNWGRMPVQWGKMALNPRGSLVGCSQGCS